MIKLLVKDNVKKMGSIWKNILATYAIIYFVASVFSMNKYDIGIITFIMIISNILYIRLINIDFDVEANAIGSVSLISNLPINRGQYVLSRYILVLIYSTINVVVGFIIYGIKSNMFQNMIQSTNISIYSIFFIIYIFTIVDMSFTLWWTHMMTPNSYLLLYLFTAGIKFYIISQYINWVDKNIALSFAVLLVSSVTVVYFFMKCSMSAFENTDFF